MITERAGNPGKKLLLYGDERQNESQDDENSCGQEETRLPGNLGKHIKYTFFFSSQGICVRMNYYIEIFDNFIANGGILSISIWLLSSRICGSAVSSRGGP